MESSAEPGQWVTRRAEYQRGIMDAISEPGVERVVLMTSAQVGKTEIINNIVGFHIAQDAAPILVLRRQRWQHRPADPYRRGSRSPAWPRELGRRRTRIRYGWRILRRW